MTFPAIADILPHRAGMLLLDAVTAHDAAGVAACATPRADAWYADEGGAMPGYLGIELMAQAVAAWVGLTARAAGKPVKQGVLLGTRRYHGHAPRFAAGQPLTVTASPVYRDESGMGSFACAVHAGERLLAEATINVYEPEDFAVFLQGRNKQ